MAQVSRQIRPVERRESIRFPLQLRLSYRRYGSDGACEFGSTVNLSRSGVFFNTTGQLAVDTNLEMTVKWPVLLKGAIPLDLWLFGRVVRANGNQAAVRIERHQFRQRSRVQHHAESEPTSAATPS